MKFYRTIRPIKIFFLTMLIAMTIISFQVLSQTKIKRTYPKPDIEAVYLSGNESLHKYINDTLLAIMNKCTTMDDPLIEKITIDIEITEKGEVVKATIINPKEPSPCRKEFALAVMKMKGWMPAIKNKKPIRSIYKMTSYVEY